MDIIYHFLDSLISGGVSQLCREKPLKQRGVGWVTPRWKRCVNEKGSPSTAVSCARGRQRVKKTSFC